jgi:hypothetical protein
MGQSYPSTEPHHPLAAEVFHERIRCRKQKIRMTITGMNTRVSTGVMTALADEPYRTKVFMPFRKVFVFGCIG